MIERIQKNLGVPWRTPTVDTLKAGGPDTPVQGIATTMMATFDVVQRAAKAGRNFVITHEPTFYNHEDTTSAFAADPVYTAKRAFLETHRMAVLRFHDNWHARRPDGIRTGMLQIPGLGSLSHGRKPSTPRHARDYHRRARRRCTQDGFRGEPSALSAIRK